MKGKLIKRTNGWAVEYVSERLNDLVWINIIPLPYVDIPESYLVENKAVDFEIKLFNSSYNNKQYPFAWITFPPIPKLLNKEGKEMRKIEVSEQIKELLNDNKPNTK